MSATKPGRNDEQIGNEMPLPVDPLNTLGGSTPPPAAPYEVGSRRAVTLLLWVIFGAVLWAGMLASAISQLHPAANNSTAAAGEPPVGDAVTSAALIILVLLVAHWYGQIPWATVGMRLKAVPYRIAGGAPVIGVIYLATMVAASRLQDVAEQAGAAGGSYPGLGVADPRLLPGDILSSAAGGVWEELALLALPLAMAAAFIPWKRLSPVTRRMIGTAVVVIVLAMRVGIHLEYRWSSLEVLVWAGAAIALFRIGGVLWPLILAHIVFDAVVFTGNRYPQLADGLEAALTAAMITGGVLVLTAVWIYRIHKHAGIVPTAGNEAKQWV